MILKCLSCDNETDKIDKIIDFIIMNMKVMNMTFSIPCCEFIENGCDECLEITLENPIIYLDIYNVDIIRIDKKKFVIVSHKLEDYMFVTEEELMDMYLEYNNLDESYIEKNQIRKNYEDQIVLLEESMRNKLIMKEKLNITKFKFEHDSLRKEYNNEIVNVRKKCDLVHKASDLTNGNTSVTPLNIDDKECVLCLIEPHNCRYHMIKPNDNKNIIEFINEKLELVKKINIEKEGILNDSMHVCPICREYIIDPEINMKCSNNHYYHSFCVISFIEYYKTNAYDASKMNICHYCKCENVWRSDYNVFYGWAINKQEHYYQHLLDSLLDIKNYDINTIINFFNEKQMYYSEIDAKTIIEECNEIVESINKISNYIFDVNSEIKEVKYKKDLLSDRIMRYINDNRIIQRKVNNEIIYFLKV